jgi:hypothetical protein
MGTVPANFHGVKGKSGRKSYRDEKLRNAVILKAWEKKNKRMTDNDATQIVLKDMGVKLKGDEDNPLEIVIKGFNYIKPNGNDNSDNSSTPETASGLEEVA